MFFLLKMNKYLAGLVASYVGIRHILPSIEVERDFNDPEILTASSTNLLFFDVVNTWYDLSSGCSDFNRYYWRRVNLIKINKN